MREAQQKKNKIFVEIKIDQLIQSDYPNYENLSKEDQKKARKKLYNRMTA